MNIIKKIYAWIVSIPKDKLLHDYAGALVTLFAFVISFIWLTFGQAFFVANMAALAVLVAKEAYDIFHQPGHTPELTDILWGLFGALKVDAALGILLLAL